MVFDYEGRLQTGRQELHAWAFSTELVDEVNFMGPNVRNLSTSECVSVDIEVLAPQLPPGAGNKPIMYPSEMQVKKFALEMSQVSIPAVREGGRELTIRSQDRRAARQSQRKVGSGRLLEK